MFCTTAMNYYTGLVTMIKKTRYECLILTFWRSDPSVSTCRNVMCNNNNLMTIRVSKWRTARTWNKSRLLRSYHIVYIMLDTTKPNSCTGFVHMRCNCTLPLSTNYVFLQDNHGLRYNQGYEIPWIGRFWPWTRSPEVRGIREISWPRLSSNKRLHYVIRVTLDPASCWCSKRFHVFWMFRLHR